MSASVVCAKVVSLIFIALVHNGLPDALSKMILEQTLGAPEDPAEMARIDEELERTYRDSMY